MCLTICITALSSLLLQSLEIRLTSFYCLFLTQTNLGTFTVTSEGHAWKVYKSRQTLDVYSVDWIRLQYTKDCYHLTYVDIISKVI